MHQAFLPSELIINKDGSIYHLGIKPDELAKNIIVVGDQHRVKEISKYFQSIEVQKQHREFVCHTGLYNNKRISVISTGIGTDNIDIVLNELDALVNIDFETRTEKDNKTHLNIVRIGTCGILQADIPVDSFILSSHALGIDNIAHFYDFDVEHETENLLSTIQERVSFPSNIVPYLTPSSQKLNNKLRSEQTFHGITVTSSGFYGPQGRKLRVPLKKERLIDDLSDFKENTHRFTNLEMECSALFALSFALGHEATAICLGLANRKTKSFSKNYTKRMESLIQYVLSRL